MPSVAAVKGRRFTKARQVAATFARPSGPDAILYDPFYLRITCETYAGKYIPRNLTRTDLIKSYLYKKAARRSIGEFKLLNVISQLAKVFYEYGRPANLLNCIHIFKEDVNVAILYLFFTNINNIY